MNKEVNVHYNNFTDNIKMKEYELFVKQYKRLVLLALLFI